jgi:hypothetical protein
MGNLNCSRSEKVVSLQKKEMSALAVSNKTLDKYFSFLRKLDNNSKKRLIIKLTESIETKEEASFDLKGLYGAWEDSKDSDQIIQMIRDSRVNNREIESF